MHETHPAAGRPPRRGEALPPLKSTRLLDQLRERIRALHYSLRTEEAYVYWCRAFIRFHRLRHPAEMGGPEVEAFLTWLASERGVSVSTHRQALSALLFLYGKVLGVQLPWMDTIARPQPRRRLPVVLSAQEVAAVLALMEGEHRLLAQVLYGTGMRLTEGLRLRVKDLDFAHRAIVVRDGKGGKDRVLMLPRTLEQPLREQLARAHALWVADRQAAAGWKCLMRSPGSTPGPAPRGPGSGCFRRHSTRWTRAAAWCGATTCTTRRSSAPSNAHCRQQVSTRRPHPTPCATVSPHTCCRPATTSAPCRNCWAIRT